MGLSKKPHEFAVGGIGLLATSQLSKANITLYHLLPNVEFD